MTRKLVFTAAVLGALSFAASRSFGEDVAAHVAHTMMAPADIKWGEGPPTLPPGGKMAVLLGDPSKAGAMFILRSKVPAGYKIPAHWHPTDENVTIISGTALMGMGDKLDAKTAQALPAGSFATMPAKEHHFFIAKTEVVLEVSAIGPFAITYINPDDDPMKGAAKTAPPAKK